jgi:gliding motility-associated-like protein
MDPDDVYVVNQDNDIAPPVILTSADANSSNGITYVGSFLPFIIYGTGTPEADVIISLSDGYNILGPFVTTVASDGVWSLPEIDVTIFNEGVFHISGTQSDNYGNESLESQRVLYLIKDFDKDGIPDKEEIGEDIDNPRDTDSDGIVDYLDIDDDNDGILTIDENIDYDENGIPDYLEAAPIFVAVNDSAWGYSFSELIVHVTDNDENIPTGATVGVVSAPQNGSVFVNLLDNTIIYTSYDSFHDNDSFVYEVCDIYGNCSEARVDVNIEMLLIIPEIFTVNGDGVNETFVIKGIENFPDNELIVFNRWGNIVYNKEGYDNSWEGWSNVQGVIGNMKLPSGTYFYVLEYGNKRLTGSVYLEK